jgi:HD superfamily phosphohydrolase YqeK
MHTSRRRLHGGDVIMDRKDLDSLRHWFDGFCSSFHLNDPEEQRNIVLKEHHTFRVCANIRRIARAESLDDQSTALAETVGLFHDLGRFPQYHRYRTFRDSDSVNHAALGADLLVHGMVLDKLSRDDQDTVFSAVRFHNAFVIPDHLSGESSLYLKLIRDADKLDIWRVFLDYYGLPEEERASAVSLGFPDLPECSPDVLDELCRGEMVNLASVRTLNDFKLLQISWIYDLNFTESFRMFQERDYLENLALALPSGPGIQSALDSVRHFATTAASA